MFATMNDRTSILKFNPYLPIFGLVLLLLLSPCKIRNFIQTTLGSPKTAVLNKSQSTISHLDCFTFEISDIVHSNPKPTLAQPDFILPETFIFGSEIDLGHRLYISITSENHPVSDIPFYILYQNFKAYS